MPKKKPRKCGGKGFGKSRKPHKLIHQNGLLLMDRKTMLEALRFVKEKEQDGFDIANAEKVTNDRHHQKILSLSSVAHRSHCRSAVPVSVFHNPDTDTAYYSPLNMKEFALVHGMQYCDEDGNVMDSVDAPSVHYAYTPFNTFFLCLDKLDELEEMLPYNEPTLDELIYLGQMDERHTPLSKEEMKNHFLEVVHACGGSLEKVQRIYRMEEDQAGELRFAMEVQVGSDGELFYQPQKTRDAWSRNLISIPIYPDKSGRTLIPAYRAVPMSVDI